MAKSSTATRCRSIATSTSARPSCPVDERRGIPHHLIDILDPDELFTAGEYRPRWRAKQSAKFPARGKLPILAGGTGFYLRALLDGLFEGPARDQALRDRLAAREARAPGIAASPAEAIRSVAGREDSRQRRAESYARARNLPAHAPPGERALSAGTRRAARAIAR